MWKFCSIGFINIRQILKKGFIIYLLFYFYLLNDTASDYKEFTHCAIWKKAINVTPDTYNEVKSTVNIAIE